MSRIRSYRKKLKYLEIANVFLIPFGKAKIFSKAKEYLSFSADCLFDLKPEH